MLQSHDPEPTHEEQLAALMVNFMFMQKHMFLNGAIENVINIQSQEDLSLLKIQWSRMKEMLPKLMALAQGRQRSTFVLSASSFIGMLFKVASVFLSQATLDKIQIVSANTCDMLK